MVNISGRLLLLWRSAGGLSVPVSRFCASDSFRRPGSDATAPAEPLRRRLALAVARRLRPAWIRSLLEVDLEAFETFAPLRRLGLPAGHRLAVVAPHPDDESIGCGGLIALWTAAGREAQVVFMTAGERGDPEVRAGDASGAVAARRRAEGEAALALLGADGRWLDGADGALHADRVRLVPELVALWRRDPPDAVAAPFPADRHPDHAAAARIVAAAGVALGWSDLPVLAYEVWSPCPANAVLDISATAARKAAAIAAHASQTATTDYVAAATGLNRYRAVTAGLGAGAAAEAFVAVPFPRYAAIVERIGLGR